MVLFRGKLERFFSLGLLLLVTACVSRQQVGVFLRFRGVTLPSDSFVDFDDILNTGGGLGPTNRNSASEDAALLCITDLVDCCGTDYDTPSGTMRTVRGDWYFPDGRRVELASSNAQFLVNRGPNEIINGQQFNGSVRLFRTHSAISERGRFRCELPSAADPSVNQTIYVNILNFGTAFNVPHVLTSSSGSNMEGEMYSLMCSSTLRSDSAPLPNNVPAPIFVWSFGPSGDDPLPSGVTDMGTTSSDSITFTSALQFSPLSQCHIGMYTCRLGPARLMTSIMVTVNGLSPINVSAGITTSGDMVLGQNGYSLTCDVTIIGTINASISYQWTKNNGTQTIQVGTDQVLSFSPLKLSDAGQYTCQATSCNIIAIDTQDITLQIPTPISVILSSSFPNPIPPFGSDVTLTCAVELSPAVDVPVTVNTVLTTDAGFMIPKSAQPVMGSIMNYITTFIISSFGRSDSGVYYCSATICLTSTNAYISASSSVTHSVRVTIGVYLSLRGLHVTNNSNINIRNVGKTLDSPNGALQCITDNLRCCSRNPRLGEWYQPNGKLVQGTTSTTSFYRTRGDDGEVSLNRPSDTESPTGQFCCEVPDGTNTKQTLCVNIGGVVSINIPSDPPIAGESYTLECSAGGSEGIFQWLGPPDGSTPVATTDFITITSTSTASQLQFRPIQPSDNGSFYICNASIDGLTFVSEPIITIVNVPSVSVQIINGGATPTAGENYQLKCTVTGAENLDPSITYRWTKNISSDEIPVEASSNILSFTPLQLADAASYVCEVTISSSYLEDDITAMNSSDVQIQFPIPSSITLMSGERSSSTNFLQTLGSDITLICTLELHSAVVPSEIFLLMVDAQLLRDGTPLDLTGPIVSGTTIIYTTQLNSFGRNDSGNYNCTATVRPQATWIYLTGYETLSATVYIKAASFPPMNVMATQSNSSAPVEVRWSPPSDGADIITGYRIFYGSGKNTTVQAVASSIGLRVIGSYVGQNISVRSEADELYSELINASITIDNYRLLCAGCPDMWCNCSSEIGIAIGASIIAECLVVMVIAIIIVLCLRSCRKRSTHKNTGNFAVSGNVAYGEVPNVKSGMMSMEKYENINPDKIKPSDQTTAAAASIKFYENIDTIL